MPEQERVQPKKREDEETHEESPYLVPKSKTVEHAKEVLEETDNLLDEIDALLLEQQLATEEQAQKFINDFVQKGGE